mmetsp:Transcript_64329/g.199196  ORF Transcript_64329/g.199196 Transcript_64329/m.199196 type:complete len:209 (-) Transcript_64329:804-1430(-)
MMGPSTASRRMPRCSSLPPMLPHCSCRSRSCWRACEWRAGSPASGWSERKSTAMASAIPTYALARSAAPSAPALAAISRPWAATDSRKASSALASDPASTHRALTRSTSRSRSLCRHGGAAASAPPSAAGRENPLQPATTWAHRGFVSVPTPRVSSRQSRFRAFSCTWGSPRMWASSAGHSRSSKIFRAASVSRLSQWRRARCHQQCV